MVETGGLENRYPAERDRGFESPSLRHSILLALNEFTTQRRPCANDVPWVGVTQSCNCKDSGHWKLNVPGNEGDGLTQALVTAENHICLASILT